MRLRKAANVVLLIPSGVGIVAGARGHVGSGFDHAEGHDWAGEHIATAGDAKQRVDICGMLDDLIGDVFGNMLGGMFGGVLGAGHWGEQENRHQYKQHSKGKSQGLLHFNCS
jgi:hypothetical protein